MSTQLCYIGLGSNIGASLTILQDAICALRKIGQVQASRLYESPPMGPQDQPNYLNAVAQLYTALPPLDLLNHMQAIENDSGRVRLRRWGERTLDLDLLLYGTAQINLARLTVPHVGLMQRDFVVLPLLDLWPDAQINQIELRTLPCVQHATARAVADVSWIHQK